MAPIDYAMMRGNLDLVELLMEKYDCKVDQTVLKVN